MYKQFQVYLKNKYVGNIITKQDLQNLVLKLENKGFNIIDQIWDQQQERVDLVSTTLLDC